MPTFFKKSLNLLGFFFFIGFGAWACTGGSGTDGSSLGSGLGAVGQAAPELDSGVVGPIVDRPLCMVSFQGKLTEEAVGSENETQHRLKGQVFDFVPTEIQTQLPDGTTITKIDKCAGAKPVDAGATIRVVMDDGSWYLEKKLVEPSEIESQQEGISGGFIDAVFEGPSPLKVELYLAPEGYEPGQELAWLPCVVDQESCVPDQSWVRLHFLNLPKGIKNWGSTERELVEIKSKDSLQNLEVLKSKPVPTSSHLGASQAPGPDHQFDSIDSEND